MGWSSAPASLPPTGTPSHLRPRRTPRRPTVLHVLVKTAHLPATLHYPLLWCPVRFTLGQPPVRSAQQLTELGIREQGHQRSKKQGLLHRPVARTCCGPAAQDRTTVRATVNHG